jgi:hypothetical protein
MAGGAAASEDHDKQTNQNTQMTNATVSDKKVSFEFPILRQDDRVERLWTTIWRCEGMAGGRRRVLVIEDDREMAEQLVGRIVGWRESSRRCAIERIFLPIRNHLDFGYFAGSQ